MTFTPDQWLILLLTFVLGLVLGMALLASPKWKGRYREEVERREELDQAPDQGVQFQIPGRDRAAGARPALGTADLGDDAASSARRFTDPVGEEFRSVADKMKIGRTMDAALQDTAERLGTPEFQFFVITIAIQRETGGNLAETLRTSPTCSASAAR